MKNLLKLHEAVAVVLLNRQPNKIATFQEIAFEIEKRNLFPNRKGGIALDEQIKLRTSIKSSRYKEWFEFIPPQTIRMK